MKNKKKGNKGNGIGAHAATSPMGHATRTKTRREVRARQDKRERQKGWVA